MFADHLVARSPQSCCMLLFFTKQRITGRKGSNSLACRHGRDLQRRAEHLRQSKVRCAALACSTARPLWQPRFWRAAGAARPPLPPCRSVMSPCTLLHLLRLSCRHAWSGTPATSAVGEVSTTPALDRRVLVRSVMLQCLAVLRAALGRLCCTL